MTAHPRNLSRDAAEVSTIPAHSSDAEFLAHIDGLELYDSIIRDLREMR